MACGCGRRTGSSSRGQIAGYSVTLPNGTVIPAQGGGLFTSYAEARDVQRMHGGGTIREIKSK